MVLPTLILQKPSATSKSKEHSKAIERRLALWKQGDLNLLLEVPMKLKIIVAYLKGFSK